MRKRSIVMNATLPHFLILCKRLRFGPLRLPAQRATAAHDDAALYRPAPDGGEGQALEVNEQRQSAATSIIVGTAPEKMSPRSVSPKMATGSVTHPGG
jgi:hypothetical protein